MDKRFSQRKSGKILAAAAASVGLAGFAASQANASLVIDVRALGTVTGGGTISADKKTVTLAPGVHVTVTMGVFARVSGLNSVQQTGSFSVGSDGQDVRNDDRTQTVVGSFQSVGGLLGNMTLGGAGQQVTPQPTVSPNAASGSTNGLAQDWDSDGDLDIGAAGTDPTNMFAGRAASPAAATITGPGASPLPNFNGWSDDGKGFGYNSANSIISPQTSEIQIGSLRFVTDANNGITNVNFVARPVTGTDAALWFEDGVATGKVPGGPGAVYGPGTPLLIIVPEPASIGLLGIASLGLLARRRNGNA